MTGGFTIACLLYYLQNNSQMIFRITEFILDRLVLRIGPDIRITFLCVLADELYEATDELYRDRRTNVNVNCSLRRPITRNLLQS